MAIQRQLFDPGERKDPWANHPDDWTNSPNTVWHSTTSQNLPRGDRADAQGLRSYPAGPSEGMHFGTLQSAVDRADATVGLASSYAHPARLAAEQFRPRDTVRSNVRRESREGKTVWSDAVANQDMDTARLPSSKKDLEAHLTASEQVGAAVRQGMAIPYRNSFEDVGSTSYRVRPEGVRTWSEDVAADPNAHPALKHVAERGYNPRIDFAKDTDAVGEFHALMGNPSQPMLPGMPKAKNPHGGDRGYIASALNARPRLRK